MYTVTVSPAGFWLSVLYGIAFIVLASGAIWALYSNQNYKLSSDFGALVYSDKYEVDCPGTVEVTNARLVQSTPVARWVIGLAILSFIGALAAILCAFIFWRRSSTNQLVTKCEPPFL